MRVMSDVCLLLWGTYVRRLGSFTWSFRGGFNRTLSIYAIIMCKEIIRVPRWQEKTLSLETFHLCFFFSVLSTFLEYLQSQLDYRLCLRLSVCLSDGIKKTHGMTSLSLIVCVSMKYIGIEAKKTIVGAASTCLALSNFLSQIAPGFCSH